MGRREEEEWDHHRNNFLYTQAGSWVMGHFLCSLWAVVASCNSHLRLQRWAWPSTTKGL